MVTQSVENSFKISLGKPRHFKQSSLYRITRSLLNKNNAGMGRGKAFSNGRKTVLERSYLCIILPVTVYFHRDYITWACCVKKETNKNWRKKDFATAMGIVNARCISVCLGLFNSLYCLNFVYQTTIICLHAF